MSHIPSMSFQFNTTIPAYRIVTMLTGTANTVKLPASSAEFPIGITKDTVLDTALSGPVVGYGIAKLQFNDTLQSGKLVMADAGGLGLGIPYVDVSTGAFYVGVLIGPTVSLTGTIADVLVMPAYKDLP